MRLPSGRFLLDTNIVIALLEGDPAVRSSMESARDVFLSSVALGELYFGAAKFGRPVENTARLDQFATGRAILDCDLAVAREYGRLKHRLRAKGRPLPENAVWIAATAIRHGLTLVTRDRHFDEVEGLAATDWSTIRES